MGVANTEKKERKMCWYCCLSLRGALYFSSSVHSFVGLVLLVRWIIIFYSGFFETQHLQLDTSALLQTGLSGIYILLFILLGCLIFAGTERESLTVLKWSSAGFIVLQVVVFTVVLVLYLAAPMGWSLFEHLDQKMEILVIAMYFCCLIATINYILVLFLYMRKLWNSKRRRGGNGSRNTSSLANIHISHPIPHQATNLPALNSSSTTNTTVSSGFNYTPSGAGQVSRLRRNPLINGPESPGIYESLDIHSVAGHQHFYPANFYSGYNGVRGQSQNEGIYNGSASIRSGTGSGVYYHSQRPYPYSHPHQRYREPLLPSTNVTASIVNSGLREESAGEPVGEEWMGAYGQRLQVFQRGQNDRSSGTAEPLLSRTHPEQQQQQQMHNY